MLERMGQALLAEGQLRHGPDLGILCHSLARTPENAIYWMFAGPYRLQLLLDLHIQGPCLHSDDIRSGIGIVCNWRTALGAKDSVDGFAGAAHAGPALGRPLNLDFRLGNYRNKRYAIVSLQS
jgi:hypothetical protein